MFTIAICDDDSEFRQLVQEYLATLRAEDYCFKTSSFSSGMALKQHYQWGKPRFNLIILDMFMYGCNGLITAKVIRQYDPQVAIMVISSSAEFAVQCYEIGACSYFVKTQDEILNKQIFLAKVRSLIGQNKDAKKYFEIHDPGGWHRLPIQNIAFFESKAHQVELISGTKRYRVHMPLSRIEQKLSDEGFIRVHKSYIVNLARISDLTKENIYLDTGEEIPLSKHRRKPVRAAWLQSIAGGFGHG